LKYNTQKTFPTKQTNYAETNIICIIESMF